MFDGVRSVGRSAWNLFRRTSITPATSTGAGTGTDHRGTVSIPVFSIPEKKQDLKVGETLEVDISSQDTKTKIKLKIKVLELNKNFTRVGLSREGSDGFTFQVQNPIVKRYWNQLPQTLGDKEVEFSVDKNELSLLVIIDGKDQVLISSNRTDSETQNFQVNKLVNALV